MGEVVVGEEGEEAEEEAGLLFDVGLDGTALRPFVSGCLVVWWVVVDYGCLVDDGGGGLVNDGAFWGFVFGWKVCGGRGRLVVVWCERVFKVWIQSFL